MDLGYQSQPSSDIKGRLQCSSSLLSSKQRIETERDTEGTTTFDVMGIWNFKLKYLLTQISWREVPLLSRGNGTKLKHGSGISISAIFRHQGTPSVFLISIVLLLNREQILREIMKGQPHLISCREYGISS